MWTSDILWQPRWGQCREEWKAFCSHCYIPHFNIIKTKIVTRNQTKHKVFFINMSFQMWTSDILWQPRWEQCREEWKAFCTHCYIPHLNIIKTKIVARKQTGLEVFFINMLFQMWTSDILLQPRCKIFCPHCYIPNYHIIKHKLVDRNQTGHEVLFINMLFEMCTLKIVDIRYFVAMQIITMERRMRDILWTWLHSDF